MTEREKNEICKGYADLIIKKEKLIRGLTLVADKLELDVENL